MLKNLRKITSLCLALLLLLSVTCFAGADTIKADGEVDIVAAKKALVAKHKDKYIEGFAETSEGKAHSAEVQELICKMQAGLLDEETTEEKLEDLGVYKLNVPGYENTTSSRSTTGDVYVRAVSVYYDSTDTRWYISGGGQWTGTWDNDAGGADGVGIKFYNTSGTYNSRVINSYMYFSDGDGTQRYVYNPTAYDEKKGTYFTYQDQVSSGKYIGKHFAVMLIFDINFENFNGYARVQYDHTWGGFAISGASVNLGSIFSISYENDGTGGGKLPSLFSGSSTAF